MADDNSRQQNQAFLQAYERQRRQKPCARTLDLRGKVPGECQAYQIGSLTHYLDDRAYTLLKQLLERTNGQYTVGVYEALLAGLKRLKTLSATTSSSVTTNEPASRQTELIRLDQAIHRQEIRIQRVTPVLLKSGDLMYHANSVDLASRALRITLKRSFHLTQGDRIELTFIDLQNQAPADLLVDLPYQISHIHHSEQHSFAVLRYAGPSDPALTSWWQNWLQRENAVIDSANELYNLTQQFYLRMFCRTLPSPLIWLDSQDSADTAEILHRLPAGENTLAALAEDAQYRLPGRLQRPLQYGVRTDTAFSCAAADNLRFSHVADTARTLFQFRSYPLDVSPEQFSNELELIAAIDANQAATLQTRLSNVQTLMQITDISAILQNMPHQSTPEPADAESCQRLTLPIPQTLRRYIRRRDDRLVIRTPITLSINDQAFQLTTDEVSENGLSVSLPEIVHITPETRVRIHFQRWKQQMPGLPLENVSYRIKNIQAWSNSMELGLQRASEQCSPAINRYFKEIIKENRARLAICYDDVLLSQQSHIFSDLISQVWQGIALFFGMDTTQKRVLQAVGLTAHAPGITDAGFWQALNQMTGRMTRQIKPGTSEGDHCMRYGLYAYRASGAWQIATDLELQSITAKTLFIQQALQAPEHYFFHCDLVTLKTDFAQEALDILEQLDRLPKTQLHKTRAVRQTLNSLFAVAHLTDIKDLIRARYAPAQAATVI